MLYAHIAEKQQLGSEQTFHWIMTGGQAWYQGTADAGSFQMIYNAILRS